MVFVDYGLDFLAGGFPRLCRIPERQDRQEVKILRDAEDLLDLVPLETADPAGPDSHLPGSERHVLNGGRTIDDVPLGRGVGHDGNCDRGICYEAPVSGIFGDFLHCVRTREKPFRDIERAHRTASHCHLGNIAYWLNRKLTWDPEKEEIIGDPEASRWLDRTKREPWSL